MKVQWRGVKKVMFVVRGQPLLGDAMVLWGEYVFIRALILKSVLVAGGWVQTVKFKPRIVQAKRELRTLEIRGFHTLPAGMFVDEAPE